MYARTLIFFLVLLYACQPPEQQVSDRTNSPKMQEAPYVVMVSLDGFRYDYQDIYEAPNLARIAKQGVRAASMQPSFPSKTFPNHYTLVTGLYPDHHGLVDNTFFDRARQETYRISNRGMVEDGYYYGGTPLWVLAEQQGMLSASYFWVGSEAPIQGIQPTYWYKYDGSVSHEKRVQQVADWLALPAKRRPHLILCYFSLVDSKGHSTGPHDEGVAAAVREVDNRIGQIDSILQASGLPASLVVVSDHGMVLSDSDNPIYPGRLADLSGFEIASHDCKWMLYSKDAQQIQQTYTNLKKKAQDLPFEVFLKDSIPAHLNYGSHERVGDIVLIAEAPYRLRNWGPKLGSPGVHGYDPTTTPEMGAIFYAKGPTISHSDKLASFENIHVYPLITQLLDLDTPKNIDGKAEVLAEILQRGK